MTFWFFIAVLLAVFLGSSMTVLLIFYYIKSNFFKPRIFIKNAQVLPVKGDIDGSMIAWGGLVFTGELYNDSEYWAYNLVADDIYAESLPDTKIRLINKIPLKLMCDLPDSEEFRRSNGTQQLRNISPGAKMSMTIKILSKKPVPVADYKQLITELRRIRLKLNICCENSSGFGNSTLFWLDLQHTGIVNLSGLKQRTFKLFNNPKLKRNQTAITRSKGLEIEAGNF